MPPGSIGGGGNGDVLHAIGVTNLSAANHFSHASTNVGPKFTATGGSGAMIVALNSIPSAANRIGCSMWDGVSEGWSFYLSRASGATPRFITRGAGSTNVDWATAYVAGDVGKVFFYSWSIDGDADLEAYTQGVSAAAIAGGTGYVPAGASSRFRIGDNAEAPTHVAIVGAAFCDTTRLTPAQHLEWFYSCRAAGRMVAAPTGTTDLFHAADAGATWTSSGSAGTVLTRSGAPTLTTVRMNWAA